MRRLVLLFVARAATAAPAASPITGGSPTNVGDFPNVVAIEIGSSSCTGTLIAPDWVLTAAHCIEPSVVGASSQQEVTSLIVVHVGTVDIAASAGRVLSAHDSIPDPLFDPLRVGQYDSGLIQLGSSVTDVAVAQLNFDSALAPAGVLVTMVGFGATAIGGASGVEHAAVQTSEPCPSSAGLDANLLCFDQSNGVGACDGDSGGPSFVSTDSGLLQLGITSFGDRGCGSFSAATRVDAEVLFLANHVLGLPCVSNADCPQDAECSQSLTCVVVPSRPGGGCDATDSGTSSFMLVLAALLGSKRMLAERDRLGRVKVTPACLI